MIEHLPFLHAIVASPDDDLPRLVYADYLEESGVPSCVARAHFIRQQTEMQRYQRGSKEFDRLYHEVEELLDEHILEWIAELELPHPNHDDRHFIYTWERGFIEGIFASWADLLELSRSPSKPLDRIPVRHLTLRRTVATEYETPGTPEIAAFLERVHMLRLTFADAFSDSILQLPAMKNLHTLDLSDNPITDRALLQLVHQLHALPSGRTLRTIDLSRCSLLTTASVHTLASARGLNHVDRLILRGLHIQYRDMQVLVNRMGHRLVV
jgi:uncharacterized protein (TIGR02996 family)